MNITTVIYDFGQVLIGWDPRRVWRRRMSESEIDAFVEEIDFARRNHGLDEGRPFAQVLAEVARDAPDHAPLLEEYWNSFADSLTGPIPGSYDLAHRLHTNGYRLLGLTNWSAETFHHALAAAPAVSLMEGTIVSGEVGIAKPDPAIFHHLLDTFSVRPQEAVFIDDTPANIAAAREIGINAIQFRGVEELTEDLVRLGVRCS